MNNKLKKDNAVYHSEHHQTCFFNSKKKERIPSPFTIFEDVAIAVGLKESIIIRIIDEDCRENRRIGLYLCDKYWWSKWSYRRIAYRYRFIGTPEAIKETILNLESTGVLISAIIEDPEENELDDEWDETKWYRVNHPYLDYLTSQVGF